MSYPERLFNSEDVHEIVVELRKQGFAVSLNKTDRIEWLPASELKPWSRHYFENSDMVHHVGVLLVLLTAVALLGITGWINHG